MGKPRFHWTERELKLLTDLGPQYKWSAERLAKTGKFRGSYWVIRKRLIEDGRVEPTDTERKTYRIPEKSSVPLLLLPPPPKETKESTSASTDAEVSSSASHQQSLSMSTMVQGLKRVVFSDHISYRLVDSGDFIYLCLLGPSTGQVTFSVRNNSVTIKQASGDEELQFLQAQMEKDLPDQKVSLNLLKTPSELEVALPSNVVPQLSKHLNSDANGSKDSKYHGVRLVKAHDGPFTI